MVRPRRGAARQQSRGFDVTRYYLGVDGGGTNCRIRLADDKKPPARRGDSERQTGLVLDERTRTKKPPMYKVLLHNDDYTTREFVVWVLQTVFHKDEGAAIAIMSHVHNNGVGVAGIYTHEVAETKVTKTVALAKAQQFPLQLSIEPTDESD